MRLQQTFSRSEASAMDFLRSSTNPGSTALLCSELDIVGGCLVVDRLGIALG